VFWCATTFAASAHEFHHVSIEDKPILVGDLPLEQLHGIVLEFNNFLAAGANEMVVMGSIPSHFKSALPFRRKQTLLD
jgi:hypothetical protein